MLTLLSVVVSCCIMVWCLFLQCSCGRWLASKPDKEKIQMNANDFIIWSWKSNCGQIEGGRGFLMLSTLDLLLRFHFIFQPCCNSRKQAHRFIPDQIDREWLNTGIDFSEPSEQSFRINDIMYQVSQQVLDRNLAKNSISHEKAKKVVKVCLHLGKQCKSSFNLTNFLIKNFKILILWGLRFLKASKVVIWSGNLIRSYCKYKSALHF